MALILKDLPAALSLLYSKCGFDFTTLIAEAESVDYDAAAFSINGLQAKYRAAKITPTKTGQFVTLWKRNGNGPIQPFDIADGIDLFIISTAAGKLFGHFVFPASVLYERKILSGKNSEGKRAIRVYPPWDNATNKQAAKTQQWQSAYFLEMPEDIPADTEQAKKLYQHIG